MEVRTATRETLDEDVRKVALQVSEVVGNVALDESKRAIEPRDYVVGVDIGPRVVDHDGDAAHEVPRNPGVGLSFAEKANQVGQHAGAFN
jgi:hypothetical protein